MPYPCIIVCNWAVMLSNNSWYFVPYPGIIVCNWAVMLSNNSWYFVPYPGIIVCNWAVMLSNNSWYFVPYPGIIVCNWAVMLSVLISLWCTFDTAGRSWVKMKRYQASVKERETRAGHKHRSGSRRRNWRNRYVLSICLYKKINKQVVYSKSTLIYIKKTT